MPSFPNTSVNKQVTSTLLPWCTPSLLPPHLHHTSDRHVLTCAACVHPLTNTHAPPPPGHETTAAVLTWALFCVVQNPEVEARLLSEIDAAVGDRTPGEEPPLVSAVLLSSDTVAAAAAAKVTDSPVYLVMEEDMQTSHGHRAGICAWHSVHPPPPRASA
jgi:hypothetical protein